MEEQHQQLKKKKKKSLQLRLRESSSRGKSKNRREYVTEAKKVGEKSKYPKLSTIYLAK